MAIPFFSLQRNGIDEVTVRGDYFLRYRDQSYQSQSPEPVLFSRSLLKPFQFLAINDLPLTKPLLLALASHSGQPEHLQMLKELSQILHVNPQEIRCPSAFPMDRASWQQDPLQPVPPNPCYHPCSGKHLLFLAQARKWTSSVPYTDQSHPVHSWVEEKISSWLSTPCSWATDSCGLPTLQCHLSQMVQLYRQIAHSQDETHCRLLQLWTANPTLTGGKGRLDSQIIQGSGGKVIAKEGADGYLMVQSVLGGLRQENVSLAIKLESGYNSTQLAAAVICLSQAFGFEHLPWVESCRHLVAAAADQKLVCQL